ncbi:MAG: hypothetical protein K2H50_06795 [Paramuribaculum sp.]|nr:hypothetical protein [Paramuribaculum sp.]
MKLKTFCIFLAMIVALPLCCKADVSLPLIPPTTEEDNPIVDLNKHRMPPAPVMCFINFETRAVSFSSAAVGEVEVYEICDESGGICLGSYDTAAEFVDALDNLSGEYCVRFITINGNYTGYINK